jgi:hypothetical protein
MTSVQKFLRQRIVTSTILQAPTNQNCYYTFIPTSGNYVGNYPPGYVFSVPADAFEAFPALNTLLIRDMGKTIKCPASATSAVPAPGATSGFFREVQLISPVTIASATASSNFGVIGTAAQSIPSGNVGDAGYGTFYIPIIIDGTIASLDGTIANAVNLPSNYLPLGGQM